MTKRLHEDDTDGLMSKTPQQKLNFSDSNNLSNEVRDLKRTSIADEDMRAPTIGEMSILQYICIGILYIVFALLVAFIIYISATWNKDRTNEYT